MCHRFLFQIRGPFMTEKSNPNQEFERLLSEGENTSASIVEVTAYINFPEAVWLWKLAELKNMTPSMVASLIIRDAAFPKRS